MGKSTVWRYFKQFVHASHLQLVPDQIKWPTHDDFKKIANEYELRWNYPMAIGSLDGSHIKIQVPKEEKSAYINYNNSYSMTLMAICDANYEFYSCFCGMSGRNHDSRVFKTSNAFKALTAADGIPESTRVINDVMIPFHILADSAFAQSSHLITPYPHRDASTGMERTFNKRHSRYKLIRGML